MAKRKRLVRKSRKTLKSASARSRIPRDKNGKFVNASGRNKSKGANVQNLQKGRRGGSRPSGKPTARKSASATRPTTGQVGATKKKRRVSKKRKAAATVAVAVGAGMMAHGLSSKIRENRANKARRAHFRREDMKANGYAAGRNYAKMAMNGHNVRPGEWYRPTETKARTYKSKSGRSTIVRPNLGGTRSLAGSRARR
ncbi:hypothetical protein SEA_LUCKYLEO_7 [Gordonia phage LuckyLeo]|nr:hypothetical protein SEA_LUCKYLEO_7 [Gordonia phage LuckyLeo]